MSKFGWSLPAGVSTLPGEEPEEPLALKCPTCGRFIKMDVVRHEWQQVMEFGPDGRGHVVWAGAVLFYRCGKCGETRCPSPIWR